MKLNYDCVRDVMLYLEENLEFGQILMDNQLKNLNYNFKDIQYTLLKLYEIHYIVATIECSDFNNYDIAVTDITYNGHKFIGEIQSDTIWDKTKSVSKELGIKSINGISQIAVSIISNLILNRLN